MLRFCVFLAGEVLMTGRNRAVYQFFSSQCLQEAADSLHKRHRLHFSHLPAREMFRMPSVGDL